VISHHRSAGITGVMALTVPATESVVSTVLLLFAPVGNTWARGAFFAHMQGILTEVNVCCPCRIGREDRKDDFLVQIRQGAGTREWVGVVVPVAG